MLGLAVRWVTVGFVPAGTSGRNTKSQRANHLNTDGLYSIVRNPLYVGNFLAILGVLISIQNLWLCTVGTLAYWLYIERIIAAEESFLVQTYGDKYVQWAAKTPAFIPKFQLWKSAQMKFSFRTVLRREYNGVMAVCCVFLLTEGIEDLVFEKEKMSQWLKEDWLWSATFLVGSILFLTLRTLKKKTRILHVTGR